MILTFKLTFTLYVCLSLSIIIGNLLGYITFGYGIGDWLYVILTALILIAISVGFIINRQKNNTAFIVLEIGMIVLMIFLILKITILRGSEYKWNGHLFL